MNTVDIILLVLLAAAVIGAVRSCLKRRKKGCCDGCAGCGTARCTDGCGGRRKRLVTKSIVK